MSIISTYVPTGKDHDLLPHSVNDDVVYEKDGEVLVGTVVEHIVSSQSDDGTVLGEKRSDSISSMRYRRLYQVDASRPSSRWMRCII